MDLGTIRDKLNSLVYTDIENFVADVRLVFGNSNKYNLVCILRLETQLRRKQQFECLHDVSV